MSEFFTRLSNSGYPFRVKQRKILLYADDLKDEFTAWDVWHLTLKEIALQNQNNYCICTRPIQDGELHHALFTRADVRGMEDNKFIHSSCNVLVLHQECHITITREYSLAFLRGIYGEAVDDWYSESKRRFKTKVRNL